METKICGKCHRELPLSEFYKNKSKSDGLQAWCKVCMNIVHKKYLHNNPDKAKELAIRSYNNTKDKHNQYDRYRIKKHRDYLYELKTDCEKCGESRRWVIEFHHIDPSIKRFSLGDGTKTHQTKEAVLAERKKCICLCANCHKEFHRFYGTKSKTPAEDLRRYLEGDTYNEQLV